jgi:hypothetical protein
LDNIIGYDVSVKCELRIATAHPPYSDQRNMILNLPLRLD